MFENIKEEMKRQRERLLGNSIVWKLTQDPLYRQIKTQFNSVFHKTIARDFAKTGSKKPRTLFIETCNICNARCVFCPYCNIHRPKVVMPLEDFRAFVDQYTTVGGNSVNLTPMLGETLLDPHLFERLDFLAGKSEIDTFGIVSNGVLLSDKKIERLVNYGTRLQVGISVGGFDRQTYKSIMGIDKFGQVQRNIETLVEAKKKTNSGLKVVIAIRSPVSKQKGVFWDHLKSLEATGLLEMESPLCFDSWCGRVKESTLTKAGLKPCPKPYKRGPCVLLFIWPMVLANGKVNACACRDVEAELIIGDLKTSTFGDVWAGVARKKLIESHDRGNFPDVCRRCTFYVSVYSLSRNAY